MSNIADSSVVNNSLFWFGDIQHGITQVGTIINCIFVGGRGAVKSPLLGYTARMVSVFGSIFTSTATPTSNVIESTAAFVNFGADNFGKLGGTIGPVLASNGSPTFNVDITDFFVDPQNRNFRLTAEAKASPHATQLKKIMLGLVNVPGITTDSLADLTSTTGGFTGVRGR
jgi:hypothetical protein